MQELFAGLIFTQQHMPQNWTWHVYTYVRMYVCTCMYMYMQGWHVHTHTLEQVLIFRGLNFHGCCLTTKNAKICPMQKNSIQYLHVHCTCIHMLFVLLVIIIHTFPEWPPSLMPTKCRGRVWPRSLAPLLWATAPPDLTPQSSGRTQRNNQRYTHIYSMVLRTYKYIQVHVQ